MASWFVIHSIETGAIVSVASSRAGVAAPERLAERGLAVAEVDFDPRGRRDRRWNPEARVFEPVDPPLPYLTTRQFLSRFTHTELEDIYDAARNHGNAVVRKRLHAFVTRLQAEGVADLNDQWLGQVVGQMQAAGVLGPGRAGEIMSGKDRD